VLHLHEFAYILSNQMLLHRGLLDLKKDVKPGSKNQEVHEQQRATAIDRKPLGLFIKPDHCFEFLVVGTWRIIHMKWGCRKN
jgi:hypothetical protein